VIDAMTLFEVEELTRYWIDHPPPHLVISAYLGVGRPRSPRPIWPRPQAAATPKRNGSVEQLLAELGPAFMTGDVHAGLGSVVLDFAELQRKTRVGS
jgi:hypothetical protein